LTKQDKKEKLFFEELCADYYEKVLRYLFAALGSESKARDCVQEVFLTACNKRALLSQHPNPGGFLFQTAKNLAQKSRREAYKQMMNDMSLEEMDYEPADASTIERELDGRYDESQYIENVLTRLTDEKRRLYSLYYIEKKTMTEIALLYGAEEPAVRMRYVRLRRELRQIIQEVADECFSS
jgi:RNA polymerase sigma-70 factor (ECF subfamily)